MAETAQTLARTAMERSNLHGFLASIFRAELTSETLRHIKSPEFLEALRDAGVSLDAAFLEAPEDTLLEEMAVEFTALFLGPGGHISPHESVQRKGASGLLWGPETSAVKRFIEAAGFQYDPDFHGIPDHIGVELEFMKETTRLEAEAWEKDDRTAAANCLEFQRAFMAGHVLQWSFTFFGKVEETAQLPFYAEMAKLAADFMRSEEETIPARLREATAPSQNPDIP